MSDYPFFDKWAVVFMRKLQADFKLDLLSSAAIVGNLGHESAGFKALQEKKPLVKGSRGGWGIAQWTGPRRRAAEAYWKRNDLDPSDMEANYKYLFVELSGPEGRVIPMIKAVDGLNAKTKVFSEVFLRPGIVHMDSRLVWSQRALKAWQEAGVPQVPVAEPAKPDYSGFWSWLLSLFKRKA